MQRGRAGHWVAVLPDGSKAYVENKNDRPFVTVIDLKARKIVARIPTPNGTEGIAASPDGKRVVALGYKEPVMFVIDPATDKIVDQVALQDNHGPGSRVRFSPDGARILTDNGNEQLVNILTAADLHGKQSIVPVGKAVAGREVKRFNAGSGIETMTWY